MNNETIQSLRNYALADKAKTTPRTDAATIPFDAKGCERDDRVPVSFARQLERELQQATADNSSLAERLTAAELELDRLGAELEELQGSHDLNQIASDALNDLRADLARVTAERDQLQSIAEKRYEEFRREANAHFVAAGEIEKLEARCGELVAALRDAVGMLEELDGLDWGEEGMPFSVDFDQFAKLLASAALTRHRAAQDGKQP